MIFGRYATFAFCIFHFFNFLSFVTYTEYLRFKNLLCGDIETRPESFNRWKFISFYQRNLNGLLARNREKIHLAEFFIVSNNIDIFCISETFLHSSVNNIYNGLNSKSDHTSITMLGGVAIYHKDPPSN